MADEPNDSPEPQSAAAGADAVAETADEPRPGAPGGSERPSRADVDGWIGARLDEISGASVGKVEGAYLDEQSGEPEWILIRVGRFGHHCVVPAREAVAGVGHVWVPWDRNSIRRSPRVEPSGALTPEEELQLCSHYGIVEGFGRTAELAERPSDETSAVSMNA